MARLLVFLQSLWALLGRARAAEAVSAGRNPKTGAPSLAHKLECHTTERQMYPNVRRTGSEGERERETRDTRQPVQRPAVLFLVHHQGTNSLQFDSD